MLWCHLRSFILFWITFTLVPLDPNNPWKNEGFRCLGPQYMGEITPQNEGFGFPLVATIS